MMGTQWAFSCKLGLSQTDCGQYESDADSRGDGRWDGCPSCVHRQPANAETEAAELAWAHMQPDA